MRREGSCAATEGEHAGRGGRWQLVAWITAYQTGPMAILHTLLPSVALPGLLACPAQQWPMKATQKGHQHPASMMHLPEVKTAQVASVLIIDSWR